MSIVQQPSRKPLPEPTIEDVGHAGLKGLVSMIPLVGSGAAELLGVLSSPIAQRRDDWLADLQRRLQELEDRVQGFRFDELWKKPSVCLGLPARNTGGASNPSGGKTSSFAHDRFTPSHLKLLAYLSDPTATPKPHLETDLSNVVVLDLNAAGLLKDGRAFTSRNRDYSDLLIDLGASWTVNSTGKQFLEFVSEPAMNS